MNIWISKTKKKVNSLSVEVAVNVLVRDVINKKIILNPRKIVSKLHALSLSFFSICWSNSWIDVLREIYEDPFSCFQTCLALRNGNWNQKFMKLFMMIFHLSFAKFMFLYFVETNKHTLERLMSSSTWTVHNGIYWYKIRFIISLGNGRQLKLYWKIVLATSFSQENDGNFMQFVVT